MLYGDVNLDGKVDISDAVLTNKAVSGVVMLNKQQYQNADCDASGEVNADDATLLMKFLVHIVTGFCLMRHKNCRVFRQKNP